MIPGEGVLGARPLRIPRESGDDPNSRKDYQYGFAYSPRERG